MSAQSGEGVDAWLDFLSGPHAAGRKIAAVDYDKYAAGEAALGWMNASARLVARGETDWRAVATDFVEATCSRLRAKSAQIAHLKIYLTSTQGNLAGNLTDDEGPPALRGAIAPGCREVKLLVNARVHVWPDVLRQAVEEALQAASGDRLEATLTSVRSFFPGRPQPTYRYGNVV